MTTLAPVISDIQESTVKVETYRPDTWSYEWPTYSVIRYEAQKGCSKYDRQASPVSSRCIKFEQDQFCFTTVYGTTHCSTSQGECQVMEHLFACK